MRCPKCNTELKPGFRFCPKCRCRVDEQQSTPSVSLQTNSYGTTNSSADNPNPVKGETVKNKAIWTLSPCEIVRHITEKELAEMDAVSGVLIEQGVTAIIYTDGKLVERMDGGVYNFINNGDIDFLTKGIQQSYADSSFMKRLWKGICNLFSSKKEGADDAANGKSGMTVDEAIRKLTERSLFSVYLIRTGAFHAMFGSRMGNEGRMEFAPIRVRTQYLDATVGITVSMSVSDPMILVQRYMAGKNSFTLADVQQAIMPDVVRVVQNGLGNVELTNGRMDNATETALSQQLLDINRYLEGLRIDRVVSIVTDDEALARLRDVAREMYLSEKELDNLIRTNAFKNRLAAEQNNARLSQARSEMDISIALDEINKDKLLHEEELERMKQMLASQRIIQNATTETDTSAALLKLRQSQMLNAEEMLKVEDSLKNNRFQRELVAENMRLDGLSALALKKQQIADQLEDMSRERSMRHGLEDARHNTTLLNEELTQHGMMDNYRDHRHEVELEQRRREEEQRIAMMRSRQELAMQGMQQMLQMDMMQDDAEHRRKMDFARMEHEERMAEQEQNFQVEMMKSDYAHMSAQQIAAAQISKIDASAQAELAHSLGSEGENAILRQQMERDEIRRREDMMRERDMMDRMERMAGRTQDAFSANQYAAMQRERERTQDMQQMKDEYRQQMQHEQERIDNTQKQSLDYITRTQKDAGNAEKEKQSGQD